MKAKSLLLFVAAIVSAALAAVVALDTPARAALRTTTIHIETHNSVFRFSAKSAPRGVVIFEIHNTSEFRHDFSIDGHTSKLITTGGSTTLRVTFLRKGRYPWRCTFDHHASFGERGVFTIT